jgi:Tfp pilus assembly protein PilW
MWSHRRPDSRSRDRGFILVEVLVAAAVAAILLAMVMRIFSSTWSSINSIREEADAMLIIRNVIDASAPRANLAAGTQQGTSGRYAWTVSISALGTPASQTAAAPPAQTTSSTTVNGGGEEESPNTAAASTPWGLFKVVVAVRAPSGRRTVLETYRLSRPSR